MRNDQIFTPTAIVSKMLDMLDYKGDNIAHKTIFEPSFGDGAFLTQIVQRVIDYAKLNNISKNNTIRILSNIYGVEIDEKYYYKTIERLNDIIGQYGLKYDWPNLKNENALTYNSPIQFDLCCANPPFIRIQSLTTEERECINKRYVFGQGNTDLYIIFFELCLNKMKPDGRLCFITPNSYFKNSSQKGFRDYLTKNNMIQNIIDYGHVPLFGNIATYTAIILLNLHKESQDGTYTLMKTETKEVFSSQFTNNSLDCEKWFFTNDSDAAFLKRINERKIKLKDICDVQYGIATNADRVYIIKPTEFDNFEEEALRPVVKASTLNHEQKIIFPYIFDPEKQRYNLISEEFMKTNYPKTYKYLEAQRESLERRDMDRNAEWYQYARSQGIQNSNKRKIAIKHTLFDNQKTCEIEEIDEESAIYSGIYIVVKNENNYEIIKEVLKSEEFCRYVKLIGKNMSGGYKSFNTAAVKNFGIPANLSKQINK